MLRSILFCCFLLVSNLASAKKFVPALIFTWEGDTITGTIPINGKPCKLSHKALYDLGLTIEFKDSKGELHRYRPFSIKGFAILCKGKIAQRFMSLHLSESLKVSKLGYAGIFGEQYVADAVFGQVISDDGFVSYYKFTGYSAGFASNGGPSGAIFTIQLLKKESDKSPIVLEQKRKEAREQLSNYLGECPKVKVVLEQPDFDVKKGLQFIINDYNLWYTKNSKK